MSLNLSDFEAVLSLMDGDIFEKFAQDFLCQVVGINFVPIGGIHDQGIDGLERCKYDKSDYSAIYQISIQKDYVSKINNTLEKLNKNGIEFLTLYYISNQKINNQYEIEKDVREKHKKTIVFRDIAWFRGRAHESGPSTVYKNYLSEYYHKYSSPGSSKIICDFEGDPRVYVFLRQQWEENGSKEKLDVLLADSLILFSLEGTDPFKGLLMSEDEIINNISKVANHAEKVIGGVVSERLTIISSKPNKKINYHTKENKYCLPKETRDQIIEKNMSDINIHKLFYEGVENRIKSVFKNECILKGVNIEGIVESIINEIFKQQGLEFSNYILNKDNKTISEKNLSDIVETILAKKRIKPDHFEDTKDGIIKLIRSIIYSGTTEELEYLKKLSNTYLMLFLLKCDPKLCIYFSVIASELNVCVCNSIIIPAISEILLEEKNRRHWNLLKKASDKGVNLFINKEILNEITSHLKFIIERYEYTYAANEDLYSTEEGICYVDEILIRSYYYHKMRVNHDYKFKDFIDNFVTYKSKYIDEEVISFLESNFGIKFLSDKTLDVAVIEEDLNKLTEELAKYKGSQSIAYNDAKTILSIYALRDKRNEMGTAEIFGYKTWWLSKDINTQKAVDMCLGEKYKVSCYMRPDFLNNYISLSLSKNESEKLFDDVFLSFLGVNLGHHVDSDIRKVIQDELIKFSDKPLSRKKAAIKSLNNLLKSDPKIRDKSKLKLFLEEEFTKNDYKE